MSGADLQGVQHELSAEARKAIDRARKILDMASRPPDDNDSPAVAAAKEAERAVAAEKFQAVLLEYNLTQAHVDNAAGIAEGRREEKKLKAGMYSWQRELWEAVAELNFCLYFCQDTWVKQNIVLTEWDGSKRKTWRWRRAKEHRIIGRMVNTQATINLAQYIEAAVERATREELAVVVGSSKPADINHMLFSRYAVSFREGAADEVMGRVNEARRDLLRAEVERAEEAKARRRAAGEDTSSDGSALVLADYTSNEADLNRDHVLGQEPGTTARKRAERAARAAAEEAAYTAWAAAHPEEAAAKEKERREENERYWKRRTANYRGGPAPKERDMRAYRRGDAAGAKIGLDIQTGSSKPKGSLS